MSNQKIHSTRGGIDDVTSVAVERRLLIHPSALVASDPKLTVVGVLNPGFVDLGFRKLLVVRVDEVLKDDQVESAISAYGGDSAVPYVDFDSGGVVSVPTVRPPNYDPDEDYLTIPTSFRLNAKPLQSRIFLNYLAHLRFFDVISTDDIPSECMRLTPSDINDQFGCEDARLTTVEGIITLTFNGIGHCGSTVQHCTLTEELSILSRRLLLPPDHKHACLFPVRISDAFVMLARPLVRLQVQDSGIWLYLSPDGVHWRPHISLINPRPNEWDSARVGPGTPPVLTERGWLIFYYGVDNERSYHVGAVLLDGIDPSIVRARSRQPVFSPSRDWERLGRRADAVFPSGIQLEQELDVIHVYYGAADTHVGKATLRLSELLDSLD